MSAVTAGERPAWMQHGACRELDSDIFFPQRGEPTAPAKAICATCPVRTECLNFALDNFEKCGIWGGMSERERRKLRSGRAVAKRINAARCGTASGYSAHRYRHEDACDPCKAAWAHKKRDRQLRTVGP